MIPRKGTKTILRYLYLELRYRFINDSPQGDENNIKRFIWSKETRFINDSPQGDENGLFMNL